MGIQLITTQHPSLQASPINARALENASTDWKTYTLVVLGNLLIVAGIVLACASIYFATFVHPMLAMGSPILPIAAGVALAHSAASKVSAIALRKKTIGDPLGIERKSGKNACFLISTLQLFLNCPEYRELLENFLKNEAELKTPEQKLLYYSLLPFCNAKEAYDIQCNSASTRSVSNIDAQHLWKCIHAALLAESRNSGADGPRIGDPKKNIQQDALDVVDFLLKRLNQNLPLIQETTYSSKPTTKFQHGKDGRENLNYLKFELAKYHNQKRNLPIKELFDDYFNDNSDNGRTIIRKYFESPPDNLSFNLNRNYGTTKLSEGEKVTEKVDIPIDLKLSKDICGKEQSYQCDGFTVHKGTAQSGHYIAYVMRNGQWWYLNDQHTNKVSLSEVEEKIKDAYFLHYKKA